MSSGGIERRLRRLVAPSTGRTVITPIDDSLIFGPAAGLDDVEDKLPKIVAGKPDAVLAFAGTFKQHSAEVRDCGCVANLTASTVQSHHTRKVLIGNVLSAVNQGLDGVAVHLNLTSRYEREMLRSMGTVASECVTYGMPLLCIAYPRREGENGDDNYDDLRDANRDAYADLVAHAVRVAVDLGADLIKTKYTGTPESFARVVRACSPVPVVVAGGALMPVGDLLRIAHDVIAAGGAGVSFGRNIFGREEPGAVLAAIRRVIHEDVSPATALQAYTLSTGHPNESED